MKINASHASISGCPLAERSESSPCCCVSYVTADSSEVVSTAVVARTDCPVWDHQHQCRWSRKALFTKINNINLSHRCAFVGYLHFILDISFFFAGFQSSYLLIHSSLLSSKSGTKEVEKSGLE